MVVVGSCGRVSEIVFDYNIFFRFGQGETCYFGISDGSIVKFNGIGTIFVISSKHKDRVCLYS